jgi:hypothetical protein
LKRGRLWLPGLQLAGGSGVLPYAFVNVPDFRLNERTKFEFG